MGATKLTKAQVIKVLRISKPLNVPKLNYILPISRILNGMLLSLAGASHVKYVIQFNIKISRLKYFRIIYAILSMVR